MFSQEGIHQIRETLETFRDLINNNSLLEKYRPAVEASLDNIDNLDVVNKLIVGQDDSADDDIEEIDINTLTDEEALARMFGDNTFKDEVKKDDKPVLSVIGFRNDYMRTHDCGCVKLK